jgi:hypothetical protein
MGAMGGAEFWLPALLSSGAGAMSSALGGGPENVREASSMTYAPGDFLDPRLQMEQAMRDRAQLQAIGAQRAAAPVSVPGMFVQPLPWRSGGGLPGPIGVTSQDPALFNPRQYLHRPGVQFAQPDFNDPQMQHWSGEYGSRGTVLPGPEGSEGRASRTTAAPVTTKRWFGGEYAPRQTPNPAEWEQDTTNQMWEQGDDPRDPSGRFGALGQGGMSPDPQVGGGIPRLMANLELMGVTADETGTLRMDPGAVANPDMFGGSMALGNPRGGIPAADVEGAPSWPDMWQQSARTPLLATYEDNRPRRKKRPTGPGPTDNDPNPNRTDTEGPGS